MKKSLILLSLFAILYSCSKEEASVIESVIPEESCQFKIGNNTYQEKEEKNYALGIGVDIDLTSISYSYKWDTPLNIEETEGDIEIFAFSVEFMKKLYTANLQGLYTDTTNKEFYRPTLEEKQDIITSAGASNQFFSAWCSGTLFYNQGIEIKLQTVEGNNVITWNSYGEEYKYSESEGCPKSNQQNSYFNIESYKYIESIDKHLLSASFKVTVYNITESAVDSLVIDGGLIQFLVDNRFTSLEIE